MTAEERAAQKAEELKKRIESGVSVSEEEKEKTESKRKSFILDTIARGLFMIWHWTWVSLERLFLQFAFPKLYLHNEVMLKPFLGSYGLNE